MSEEKKHVPHDDTQQMAGESGNFYEENPGASRKPSVEERVQALLAEDKARAREDAVKGDAKGTAGFVASQQESAQKSKGPRKSALDVARALADKKK